MIEQLILKNRSYRRFFQEKEISLNELKEMINMARLSPSARNSQSLKYVVSNSESLNKKIFPNLAWAGYLKDWPGPVEGERPSAYIIMLNDKEITENYFCDHGIAAQSILLKAVEMGYGGCIIGSVNFKGLAKVILLPGKYKILQVIALGKPKETIILEDIKPDGDYKYWRDEKQAHHVPKRSLNEIILKMPL